MKHLASALFFASVLITGCSTYDKNGPHGFKETPQDFEGYLNNATEWGRGKKVKFSNLDKCYSWNNLPAWEVGSSGYSCQNGFASFESPSERYTCEIYQAGFSQYPNSEKKEWVSFTCKNSLEITVDGKPKN